MLGANLVFFSIGAESRNTHSSAQSVFLKHTCNIRAYTFCELKTELTSTAANSLSAYPYYRLNCPAATKTTAHVAATFCSIFKFTQFRKYLFAPNKNMKINETLLEIDLLEHRMVEHPTSALPSHFAPQPIPH